MAEQLKSILLIFIAVVVALPLMLGIVGITNPQTQLSTATNEEINLTPAYIDAVNINESVTFTLDYGQATTGNTPISSFVLGNSTDDATVTTDYVVDLDAGTFTLKNSSFWQNTTQTGYADYQYKDSSYMDTSFARVLTALIIGIASLALLAGIIAWLMKMFSYEK